MWHACKITPSAYIAGMKGVSEDPAGSEGQTVDQGRKPFICCPDEIKLRLKAGMMSGSSVHFRRITLAVKAEAKRAVNTVLKYSR